MPSANAVHLVGSNHKWGLEALENAQGLDGLGLEALVYIHDQHCQIGQGAAPAAHGCECMVARRINEQQSRYLDLLSEMRSTEILNHI